MEEFYTPTADEMNAMMAPTIEPLSVSETEEQMARRAFRQALPGAAQAIIDIAHHGMNERTRLTAAQYIVERNMGKVGQDPALANTDTLRGLVEGLTEEIRIAGEA